MNLSPVFIKPLFNGSETQTEGKNWDNAIKQFEDKKYKESVLSNISYINKNLIKKYGNKNKDDFIIPHGNIFVHIQIKDSKLFVESEFVKINPKNIIPVSRNLLNLNMYSLNLSYIVLEDNIIKFKYSCDLESCFPYKVYDVFRQISYCANNNIDEFVEKFGAEKIKEPKISYFSKKQYIKIHKDIKFLIEQCEKYRDYFNEKLLYGYTWDIIVQTILNIDCYISPQGIIKKELEIAISTMHDKSIDVKEKIVVGNKFLDKFKNFSVEDLKTFIYKYETFISNKAYYNNSTALSNLQTYYSNSRKEIYEKGDFKSGTLTIRYGFLYGFYIGNLEKKLYDDMVYYLAKSSNKEWKKSSTILFNGISDIMNLSFRISTINRILLIILIVFLILSPAIITVIK